MSCFPSVHAAPFLLALALGGLADFATAQGNDCSTATPIAGAGTFAFDNATNTTSGFTGVNCTPAIQRDVFWRWTASQAGDYEFDTFGTSFDTNMSVHSGGDCNATCVGTNDNSGSSLQSSVQVLGVQAGEELLVQVGSFLLFAGPGQMNVTQINNPCAGLAEDAYEPNDSCVTRPVLNPGIYTNLFLSQTDPDCFGVLIQPGERIEVEIVGQTAGDVDLTLYDSGCNPLVSDGVRVGYTHLGTAAHVLVVEAFLDTSSNSTPCALYDLDIRITTDPCVGQADDVYEDHDICNSALPVGNGTWAGLHVDRWDKDFFEFCVPAQTTVTLDALFSHAQGDLDMFLWADWSYPCGIGTAGPNIAESTSVNDNETITWTNAGFSNQRCYLEISMWDWSDSSCNDYDLVIQGVEQCFIGSTFCGPAQANSAGQSATMSARGSFLVSDNHVVLVAANLPDARFGYFLASQGQGLALNPAGSWGHLCLAGTQPIGRMNEASRIGYSQGGRFEVLLDLNRIPEPPGYTSIQAGETWHFQAWYRDTMGAQAGSNFTDGLQISFQ